MSASVGIAVYTGNDISADSLLRHADQALYQAKITGRNRHHFFDADLDEQVRTHHNRRTEVRAAVRANELVLYYQPKLDMRKGRIIGMEALLRWEHPLRGTIAPGEFLPIVEHSDVIVDIGEWVLREALRQLQRGVRSTRWVISVNIAARHFQRPDFVERLTPYWPNSRTCRRICWNWKYWNRRRSATSRTCAASCWIARRWASALRSMISAPAIRPCPTSSACRPMC
jgi:predicted signal transduction protein with EAL and GGDEF domain